jgi:hypothetical protein
MDSVFLKMIDTSIRRLAIDRDNGFSFLRQVPSSHAKLFVSYWDQAEGGYWNEYLKSDFHSEFWNEKHPQNFESYIEKVGRRWEFLPNFVKSALGMMFVKTGKIPTHLQSPEMTDAVLKQYANYQWLSKKAIKTALSKHFEMELLNREDSSDWRISAKRGVNDCETRLIISTKTKGLSYFHTLNNSSPFLLIDHAGTTFFPQNWDLVSSENLENVVLILKQIVTAFEASVP